MIMDNGHGSNIVQLWVRRGDYCDLVREMELAGSPIAINPGYRVIFRVDELYNADEVEIRFVRTVTADYD